VDLPLGLEEDIHREFKATAALREPANIAREIVAFLNSDDGGEVWIGLGEKDGVAVSVEAIPNIDREQSRLQNAIVDLVEPSPVMGRDVVIKIIPLEASPDSGVLLITVKGGPQKPYALRRQSSRAFLRRTGSRIREMTRDEIAAAFQDDASVKLDAVEEVKKRIAEEMRKVADDGKFSGLRLVIQSASDVQLALDRSKLEALLRQPQLTGNRRLGWNFASDQSALKPMASDGWKFGEVGKVQWLSIRANGRIEFNAVLERLFWRGAPNELWPFALIELPVSVVRLAQALFSKFSQPPLNADASIVMALGLFQIGQCTLAPYSPQSIGYMMPLSKPKKYVEISQETSFITDPPLVIPFSELDASPDLCAYALIRHVYRAFEYEEDKIPREFDPTSGELRFPA
jgi:hypothetical protein